MDGDDGGRLQSVRSKTATLASLVSDLAEFSFTRSYAQKRIQIVRRMGDVPSFDGPTTANASVFLDITPTMATGMDEL